MTTILSIKMTKIRMADYEKQGINILIRDIELCRDYT